MERKIDLKSNGIMPKQIVYDTHTNSLQLNYTPPVEFKIGDKVRLKKNLDLIPGYNYSNTEYTKGMNDIKNAILTVERISNSTGSLDCTNNINNDWWWYKPEWLEHVVENPGPKFKIGDTVTVKNIKGNSRSISGTIFASTMRQFIGNTYNINHVFSDGDVRLAGCGSYVFAEEWLETLLENSIRRYKVGDILQCIDHPAVFILQDYPRSTQDGYSAIAGLTSSGKLEFNTDYIWGNLDTVRLATYDETKVLLNALARQGKEFNSDTLEIEDIKPEFKRGDILTAMKATPDGKDITFVYDEYIIPDKGRGYFKLLCGGVYYHPFEKIKELRNRGLKYGFNINNVRYASDKEIEKFDNDLKEIGKKWNRETLQVENLDISDIAVDLGSACRYLKKPIPQLNQSYFMNADADKFIAQITLQLIREAWNKFDGFEVDLKNNSIRKYYPVLSINDNISYAYVLGTIHLGPALFPFPTQERALQFGKQFKELFKIALGNDL